MTADPVAALLADAPTAAPTATPTVAPSYGRVSENVLGDHTPASVLLALCGAIALLMALVVAGCLGIQCLCVSRAMAAERLAAPPPQASHTAGLAGKSAAPLEHLRT